jgi:hypothetical protein
MVPFKLRVGDYTYCIRGVSKPRAEWTLGPFVSWRIQFSGLVIYKQLTRWS